MRIRYIVIARGQQFEVFRESVCKGAHTIRARAIDAARTMARLEARLARTPSEVLVEDESGQLGHIERYDPYAINGVSSSRVEATAPGTGQPAGV